MIFKAMQDLVNTLRAGGVRAALDRRDLNPPGVLVMPPTVEYQVDPTWAEAEWTLLCAVPDSGTGTAAQSLSDLVEQVREALGWTAVSGRAAQVTTTDGPPSPAYALTFTTQIGD